MLLDIQSKLATLSATDGIMASASTANVNMKTMITHMINNDAMYPIDRPHASYSYLPTHFGYDSKLAVDQKKKSEEDAKRRWEKMDEVRRLNMEMWEKLGPPPYPRVYEYCWPLFHKDASWEQSTNMWDICNRVIYEHRSIVVPEGGYNPGTLVPERPYDEQTADMVWNAIPPTLLGNIHTLQPSLWTYGAKTDALLEDVPQQISFVQQPVLTTPQYVGPSLQQILGGPMGALKSLVGQTNA